MSTRDEELARGTSAAVNRDITRRGRRKQREADPLAALAGMTPAERADAAAVLSRVADTLARTRGGVRPAEGLRLLARLALPQRRD
jgi:hypothetical protein